MFAFVCIMSLSGMVICSVLSIVSFFKKDINRKKWLKILGGCSAVFILSVVFIGSKGEVSKYGEQDISKRNEKYSKKQESSNIKEFNTFIGGYVKNFKLNDKTIKIINENIELFPAKTDADVKKLEKMIDYSIEYKHLDKAIDDYLEKTISIVGNVLEIKEVKINNNTNTYVHIVNNHGESYQVFFLGNLKSIFKNTSVAVTGLPVCQNNFNNVGGGVTNSIVLIGGSIEDYPYEGQG